jgi:hypothetical protein
VTFPLAFSSARRLPLDPLQVEPLVRNVERPAAGAGARAHAHGGRQVLEPQHVAFGEQQRALHHRLEFAHVARPGIADEGLERLGRDVPGTAGLAVLGEEMLDQQRDIGPPLAQRRQPGCSCVIWIAVDSSSV